MLPVMRRSSGLGRGWDPFEAMQRELDRITNGDWAEGMVTAAYPVDIHEDENHLFIEAELPGFKKEEIDLTLENGVLTITAQRSEEHEKDRDKRTRHLHERRFARVQRAFTLPTTVDESKVDAKLDDGVLKITLNKREEVKPRKITVK